MLSYTKYYLTIKDPACSMILSRLEAFSYKRGGFSVILNFFKKMMSWEDYLILSNKTSIDDRKHNFKY